MYIYINMYIYVYIKWTVLWNDGCLLTYIVVYKFDVSSSSTMTLWYFNSPFCLRPSKRYLY